MYINQITLAQLAKAYSKLKCEPLRIDWVDVDARKCSPFVAIAIYLRKFPARVVADMFYGQSFEYCCKHLAIAMNTHICYVAGVELGFSLMTKVEMQVLDLPQYLTSGKEFILGYEDGQKFARAFE